MTPVRVTAPVRVGLVGHLDAAATCLAHRPDALLSVGGDIRPYWEIGWPRDFDICELAELGDQEFWDVFSSSAELRL